MASCTSLTMFCCHRMCYTGRLTLSPSLGYGWARAWDWVAGWDPLFLPDHVTHACSFPEKHHRRY